MAIKLIQSDYYQNIFIMDVAILIDFVRSLSFSLFLSK